RRPGRRSLPPDPPRRGRKARIKARFFFQAEDGIRDFHVTGVQTCALPIYAVEVQREAHLESTDRYPGPQVLRIRHGIGGHEFERSEERRVGKEGRTQRPLEPQIKRINITMLLRMQVGLTDYPRVTCAAGN